MHGSISQEMSTTMETNQKASLSTINTRLNHTFVRSVASIFVKQRNLPKLFFSVTKKLGKFFSISGALLIVHSSRDNRLKVIATRKESRALDGLALTLPSQKSLFYTVYNNGEPYVKNYPEDFEGNFIEQKLLLDDDTKSLVICPTMHNGFPNGLVCFTSPVPYAFVMFEKGFLQEIMEQFGSVLNRETRLINI
ncbi:MAG: hypothetical protein JW763_00920 [candidate division Zixibacteria bacterium]|nr:hypothetical protein [candidate division Zixibacteria bacterium]